MRCVSPKACPRTRKEMVVQRKVARGRTNLPTIKPRTRSTRRILIIPAETARTIIRTSQLPLTAAVMVVIVGVAAEVGVAEATMEVEEVTRGRTSPFVTPHSDYNQISTVTTVPRAEVPVGGRLSLFVHQWREITSDVWTLEVVGKGYRLEFIGSPPLNSLYVTTSGGTNCPIKEEVKKLLLKGAVRTVSRREDMRGFYSHFFLRPKKTGGLRPILNLRPLNQHLTAESFRMDHLGNIVPDLQVGLWAISIDLTDAYLHIPIWEGHQHFLRFALSPEEVLQFLVLCFGLKSAPRVFTKIVLILGAFLRKRGFQIYMYLDDWLLVHKDRSILVSQAQDLVNLTLRLGFLINWEKSDLIPKQMFNYLGVRFDLRKGLQFPSEERVVKLLEAIQDLRLHQGGPVALWLRTLGIMVSCIHIIPWARLRLRPIQLYLLAKWKPSSRDLKVFLAVNQFIEPHLQWWTDSTNVLKGSPIKSPNPQIVMETDACTDWGWGGYVVGGAFAQGKWSPAEKVKHINWLELMAVWNCLQVLEQSVKGKAILVRSDNTTVVSYINKMGGTHSPQMCYLLWDVMLWCQKRDITIKAVHLAGIHNSMADSLSRKRVSPLEWELEKGVVKRIFGVFGKPHIDLFASKVNKQINSYCSWNSDPEALAVDALAMSWDRVWGYAFPPIVLIPKVLEKIQQHGCRIILIAPAWPKRSWYVKLLNLLYDKPLWLGSQDDLLTQDRGRVCHQNPDIFQLAAWPLSGEITERKAFTRRLPNFLPNQSDLTQDPSTKADLKNMWAGVREGKLIHFDQILQ